MNVLIVTEVYRPGLGGLQQALDTLIEGLRREGDSVTVLTGSPRGLVRPYDETEPSGAVVHRLPAFPAPFNPKNNRICFLPSLAVRRFFRRHSDFDVIHFHTPASWLHLAVMREAKARNIPTIVTNHSLAINATMNKNNWAARTFVAWAERKTIEFVNQTDLMTAPTTSALTAVHGVTVPRVAVSNGVDTEYYAPRSPDNDVLRRFNFEPSKKLLIYTGRLDGEKRVDLLLQAMEQLEADRSDVQLAIVGAGMLEQQLKAEASSRGLDKAVKFCGYISKQDKRSLLQSSDIFVMPSPAELQCISGLEALACGLAIVVADQIALPELTNGGKNGDTFTYPDVSDLVRKLTSLLDDEKQCQKMSQAGREWVTKHHDHHQNVPRYREQYASIVHPSGSHK